MALDHTWVRSGRDDAKVALFERHPEHPHGEVFVAASQNLDDTLTYTPWEVAKTPRVMKAIADKELVEVAAPSKAAQEARDKATTAAAAGGQAQVSAPIENPVPAVVVDPDTNKSSTTDATSGKS